MADMVARGGQYLPFPTPWGTRILHKKHIHNKNYAVNNPVGGFMSVFTFGGHFPPCPLQLRACWELRWTYPSFKSIGNRRKDNNNRRRLFDNISIQPTSKLLNQRSISYFYLIEITSSLLRILGFEN